MAEIGLVKFARLALAISESVLPLHRTKFSKRQFTQPQLLTVLCLMRYEDWIFREAEVRLSEDSELRSALRLRTVAEHHTSTDNQRLNRSLSSVAGDSSFSEQSRSLNLSLSAGNTHT